MRLRDVVTVDMGGGYVAVVHRHNVPEEFRSRVMSDGEITKGFVLEHAAYWSDKEAIGYAMDEAFVHELDVEDLRELVFDLAVRLDSINLDDDEFEEDYGDDIHPRDDD